MLEREKLLEKAKELSIDVKDEMTDEEIDGLISSKEEESDDDTNEKDLDYWKAEFEKARDKRDSVKKDSRKLKEQIKKLEDLTKNAPKTEELDDMKKELKELKKFKEEIDEKEEEKILKDKSELERETIKFNKKFDEFKTKMEDEMTKTVDKLSAREETLKEKDDKIEELRLFKLDNEIGDIALKNKAYNPKQIVKLVRDAFTYDKNLDKFSFLERDDKGKIVDEKTVDEYVTEFLKDSDNENLIESTVNTSGSHTKTTQTKTTDTKGSKKYNVKDPDLVKEAEYKGLSVEDLIDIKEMRDAKMEKIRANRKK